MIFEGHVGAGQISISENNQQLSRTAPQTAEPFDGLTPPAYTVPGAGVPSLPALRRPAGPQSDPNNGRFGGRSEAGGFSLTAGFEPTSDKNSAMIVLTVEAGPGVRVSVGDFAWFILHQTFPTPEVKVSFQAGRARLRIQVRGGFTVGVWLPSSGVELECNLRELERAPRIIKER